MKLNACQYFFNDRLDATVEKKNNGYESFVEMSEIQPLRPRADLKQ